MNTVQKIGKDCVKKFIVRKRYGHRDPEWPTGEGATIILSTVKIFLSAFYISEGGPEILSSSITKDCPPAVIRRIYKNDRQNHAERKFLGALRREINSHYKVENVSKIQVDLLQNYSPCNMIYQRYSKYGCADAILKFKDEMEQKSIELLLTIKFANFYLHQKKENRKGLMTLLQNGIELELLQGEDTWKAFLSDKNFVELTGDEKQELLERATTEERKDREKEDVKIMHKIKQKALANGKDKRFLGK